MTRAGRAYTLRGRGLLAARRNDRTLALELLTAAPQTCRRLPDTHQWVEAYCLDALCSYAVARGLGSALERVAEREAFAARRGLREMVARAALHRTGLGQPGAREAATLLLAGIDNPSLTR
ncbi:hypothetical protein ACT4S2_16970 [Kocuria turfanensis]|uniref:hypothetical protein n=1 Tax=Kocuria turfanensis TaxID=388357 RepID=UPI0040366E31